MKVEFVINSHPEVTRIAILEDGRVMELIVEGIGEDRQVGNIYLGRINAVLPGMQAAFVDIGLERSAFLHVSDVRTYITETEKYARSLVNCKPIRTDDVREPIEKVLQKGQSILVQVTKDPISTKGARVTTRVSIAGRYIVSMPGETITGISKKISGRDERTRLRKILSGVKTSGFGIIARTAGTAQDSKAFQADMDKIVERWKEIGQLILKSKAPALLHKEHDIVTATMRDLVASDTHAIVTDSKTVANDMRKYLKAIAPEIAKKVKFFRGKTPIFDYYRIEKEISGLMAREVQLKSGGSIVIEHTEALVAIDVNTKRYTGKKKQADTILKTNLEAAIEVARQLRFRDMGGIIVIDFIDMYNAADKEKVLNSLRSELGKDRSPTKTCQVSTLGLVEMTRKRVRPSLVQTISDPCPCCSGTGRVLSLVSVATKLQMALERASLKKKHKNLIVSVHPLLAEYLRDADSGRMEHIASIPQLNVQMREESTLRVDEYELYSLDTHEDVTGIYNNSGKKNSRK